MNPAAQPQRRHPAPPEPGPLRPFHLPDLETDALSSGLRIRSMARREIPLVSGCLVLDAGEATVAADSAGLAVLTGDSLTGGTEQRSAVELAEALEGLGVNLRVSTGWDATTVSFTALADRLDSALELLSEIIRTPTFPDDEVERVRRQRLAAIQQRRMQPGQLAADELDRVLFPPEHPYRRPLSGELESVTTLDRAAASDYARRRYRPDRSGFVLVGDLSPTQIMEKAERHLLGWSGSGEAPPTLPEVSLPSPRPIRLVHREGAVQSEIRVGHPGPRRVLEGEAELEVANAILGGSFTSRLNLNLREKHGFTYGVRSSFARRRQGGTFSVGTSVQTDVTVRALEETFFELRRFVAQGPTDEEVAQARDYLAGVFPLRMETTAQLAARLAELVIFELPEDYHHRYRDRIRSVETAGVHRAASEAIEPESAAIVVVGDAHRLESPLRDLGLGEVELAGTEAGVESQI
jgi:zinc protease